MAEIPSPDELIARSFEYGDRAAGPRRRRGELAGKQQSVPVRRSWQDALVAVAEEGELRGELAAFGRLKSAPSARPGRGILCRPLDRPEDQVVKIPVDVDCDLLGAARPVDRAAGRAMSTEVCCHSKFRQLVDPGRGINDRSRGRLSIALKVSLQHARSCTAGRGG